MKIQRYVFAFYFDQLTRLEGFLKIDINSYLASME